MEVAALDGDVIVIALLKSWSRRQPASVTRRRYPMVKLIAATMRQGKRLIPFADTSQNIRQIGDAVGDDMHDLAFTLKLAVNSDHARRQDDTSIFFEGLDPNDGIGNSSLIFKRHEDDPLRRARPLTNKHETSDLQPATVIRLERLSACHDPTSREILA